MAKIHSSDPQAPKINHGQNDGADTTHKKGGHHHKTHNAPKDGYANNPQAGSSTPPPAPAALPDANVAHGAEPASAAAGTVAVPVVPTTRTINVSSDAELKAALSSAGPGDNIKLAKGTYTGPITLSGKTGVTLSGDAGATLKTSSTKKPSLSITDCKDCSVVGLNVQGGQKGIMAINTQNTVFDHVDVSNTQMEGVHFKNNSSDITFQNSSVHDTGLGGDTPAGNGRVQSDDGEGIYVGTAKSNNPDGDASNNVKIINNHIYNTTAENIDIKEFTKGGIISQNILDGQGAGKGATANVEVKGSGYTVTGNSILHPVGSGIKNYSVKDVPLSGTNNTIENNTTN